VIEIVSERRVYLFRHAQSASNAGGRTKDPFNIHLTKLGKEQAKFLANLNLPRPDLIVHSSYTRTKETAQPILKKFPEVPKEIWPVQEFTYLSAKQYANTTMEDRKEGRDIYWDKLDQHIIDGEGAESFWNFMHERVGEFLETVRNHPASVIYIFTHGQFIKGVFLRLFNPDLEITGEAMKRFRKLNRGIFVPNASVTELLIKKNKIFISGLSAEHIPHLLRTE
jgi:broad specificity phosphatase PhoE